jgi:hypothetical protein
MNNDKPRGATPIRKLTVLDTLFEELNAGVFRQQVERALSDVALGVVTHGEKNKKGKVTLTFDMVRIGESNQVNLTHKLEYRAPTARGKRTEDATSQTPLHVGRDGRLTLMPDTQNDMFKDESTG